MRVVLFGGRGGVGRTTAAAATAVLAARSAKVLLVSSGAFGVPPGAEPVAAGELFVLHVDVPTVWPEFTRDGVRVLDGEVVELDGWRFGFVGGGLPSPMRTPFEVPEDRYAAKVAALGQVDVLCSHIPPAVPELLYDTVARRFEKGSTALLAAIRATQPRYALFGHVHQPLQQRLRIGRTECVNVGHFRATGRPWVLTWER